MLLKQWSFGERVVHVDRPEWGVGQVTAAVGETHEGKPCQRLTIRFDRAGLKTLTTALANLVNAASAPAIHAEAPQGPEGPDPFAGGGGPSAKDVMLRLPDAATDPFCTARQRLETTLKLYRYSEHGGSLLDWASAQSGLKDPMTRFNRHELEDLYKRFVFVRDEHLKRLAGEIRKNEPALLTELGRNAPRSAQQVLRRFDGLR